ncbi:MAG TPA: aminotransferase class I/II-fold pyridoxal phosphate-dependent enzyme [Caldisericia bacterium]|nr:aminotransferase class I/II-fold pyridoxal phosphate-dependent enzyme [Caldisericia bacterium]HPF48147.1 aminotransferase class I/II-fold pyridoxal phosphate-dependent enzyme [Caldisericia bacterium]HPI83917.1 aminotransferase class I/II-fold pyridoxal phosphate-dependent enzyme [Caldisericia bacterium]HPQ92600.1 aminotransferase class I/II-fold pyridoxal phosphate-dependent enzyme [Caldisericia bacterium]HRV74302.1 aminotransferase class I/II-fold pyridoxal phosphate-dependent enzyme [Caldi
MEGFGSRIKALQDRLDKNRANNHDFYHKPIEAHEDQYVRIGGKRYLNFTTYSYLGLLGHPKINQAAIDAINEFGTGTHGVRILAGTTSLHEKLEKKIANFKKTEAAAVFSSGYVTNLTAISTICGRGDAVFCDMINHASIYDGCLLSSAKFCRFKHNDLADLRRKLEETEAIGRLIVVDAVFSMDGDIAPLPQLVELAKEFNALLYVDEAHSLGVLGETGHGIMEHFGLTDGVDIQMGTLSKTIPAVGGYVAASNDIVEWLKYRSRAFVFSAALPPGSTGAAYESFCIIEDEQWRIKKLRENIDYFIKTLKAAGFDTGPTETAVVPIILCDEWKTLEATRRLFEKGVFIMPILQPAVPPNTSRLRANVTALHTKEDIDYMVNSLSEIWKDMGLN